MKPGKLIVIAAPSGSGKTSIVKRLIKDDDLKLSFSISATTREPRHNEREGKDYYFKRLEEFKSLIQEDAFIEWEEVYKGQYYGTLHKEVDRLRKKGYNVIFDIDVNGALTIKNKFNEDCLALFIQAPDLESLKKRLLARKTESKISLEKRLEKVEWEMSKRHQFDEVIINDHLDDAVANTRATILEFINDV